MYWVIQKIVDTLGAMARRIFSVELYIFFLLYYVLIRCLIYEQFIDNTQGYEKNDMHLFLLPVIFKSIFSKYITHRRRKSNSVSIEFKLLWV